MNTEMQAQLARAFLLELGHQCDYVSMACADLKQALAGVRMAEMSYTMNRIWYSIHGLVTALGNISKILWPPDPRSSRRGGELRNMLKVPDDSHLKKRVLRDHLEHFDERLERLVKEPCSIFDTNVGSLRMCGLPDKVVVLRHFDPRIWEIKFGDDNFELKPLLEAVRELRGEVDRQLSHLLPNTPCP